MFERKVEERATLKYIAVHRHGQVAADPINLTRQLDPDNFHLFLFLSLGGGVYSISGADNM